MAPFNKNILMLPLTLEQINKIEIHFILCLARTGSSMLTAMLNQHEELLSPSEEPFLLYFHNHYKNKTYWTERDIDIFLDRFWLMAEKNLSIYYSDKATVKQQILPYFPHLSYIQVCKLIYLHFLPQKDKSAVRIIVDKQLKYFYFIGQLLEIVPNAKFIILTRDYRDLIVTWRKRNMTLIKEAAFIAKIWQLNYWQAIFYIKNNPENFMHISYESLVQNPQVTLQSLCRFLNVEYKDNLLNFHLNINNFFEKQEPHLDKFIDQLKDFHSGLRRPINTDKLFIGQKNLPKNDLKTADYITAQAAVFYGYNPQGNIGPPDLKSLFYTLYAFLMKKILPIIYLKTPFLLKITLRSLRKNKINP